MAQPRNIFDLINANIVAIGEDMNTMHKKIDAIYTVLFQTRTEEPKPAGESASIEDKISGQTNL